MSAGKGYLALAALIFGQWRPLPTLGACLLFAFADAAQARLQGTPLPASASCRCSSSRRSPYVLTVALLAGFVGRAVAPRAIGVPYVEGSMSHEPRARCSTWRAAPRQRACAVLALSRRRVPAHGERRTARGRQRRERVVWPDAVRGERCHRGHGHRGRPGDRGGRHPHRGRRARARRAAGAASSWRSSRPPRPASTSAGPRASGSARRWASSCRWPSVPTPSGPRRGRRYFVPKRRSPASPSPGTM